MSGRRLLDVPIGELLSIVWYEIYSNADPRMQRKLNLFVLGRLGPDGGEIVDDPNMPSSLRGREAPEGWADTEDPFSDGWNLNL